MSCAGVACGDVPRVVALCGKQGWRRAWAHEVGELVFALDADAAGQQQWRALARLAVLRGKQVAVLLAAAYGGWKDASEAWAAGVLRLGAWPVAAGQGREGRELPQDLQELWQERPALLG